MRKTGAPSPPRARKSLARARSLGKTSVGSWASVARRASQSHLPTYQIRFAPSAIRELKRLPLQAQLRIDKHIGLPRSNPRPPGVTKLAGELNAWRIRVGDYRVIYEIHNKVLLIMVLRVAHRREVYR